ncbi:hypothetical protein ACI3PL_27805, partial [Lacticaseibacillus paracasei]
GFGTNIAAPWSGFDFAGFCARRGVEGFEPCAIADFVDYGLWVQRELVPRVEATDVVDIAPAPRGFRVTLASGERCTARRVVVA